MARGYQGIFLALKGDLDDSRRVGDHLLARVEERDFDHGALLAHAIGILTNLILDPPAAVDASETSIRLEHAALGNQSWGMVFIGALARAALGDVDATNELVASTEDLVRDTSNDDGLPDLILAPRCSHGS
jgi:hypothetical protein